MPSAIAAVLTMLFALVTDKQKHRLLGYTMVFFATLELLGYVLEGELPRLGTNGHSVHAWLGILAVLLSIGLFIEGVLFRKERALHHCRLGYVAAVFSFATLFVGTLLLTEFVNLQPSGLPTIQVPALGPLHEVEAQAFKGVELTPLQAS